MNRKPSLIPGLERILSAPEASVLLDIPEDELLNLYQGQREISLRNLLKRICRSNPIYHFPVIGETTYTLRGVMNTTGKGRSWSIFFLERNHIRHWCVGVHYLYSKAEVDDAWRKESFMWEEWIPLIQVSCVYGVDLRTVLQQKMLCYLVDFKTKYHETKRISDRWARQDIVGPSSVGSARDTGRGPSPLCCRLSLYRHHEFKISGQDRFGHRLAKKQWTKRLRQRTNG